MWMKDEVYKRDKGKCRRCQHKVTRGHPLPEKLATFDHIRRFSEGGTTTVDNLQILCHPCHKIKDDIVPRGTHRQFAEAFDKAGINTKARK